MCNKQYLITAVTSNRSFVLQTTWVLDSCQVFSQLRHVQIVLMLYEEDEDKILYLVSLLRVAPFIQKLEVHVSIFHFVGNTVIILFDFQSLVSLKFTTSVLILVNVIFFYCSLRVIIRCGLQMMDLLDMKFRRVNTNT